MHAKGGNKKIQKNISDVVAACKRRSNILKPHEWVDLSLSELEPLVFKLCKHLSVISWMTGVSRAFYFPPSVGSLEEPGVGYFLSYTWMPAGIEC